MKKFNARYKATIITPDEQIIVQYPITCKFSMRAGTLSQATRATIQFFNLAPSTRNKIFQDAYIYDTSKWKYITFEAGYENEPMTLCFKGRIMQAYSYKSSGAVDVITDIQALPLNILGCYTSCTFEAGTTFQEAHNRIVSDMPDLIIGNVGSLEGAFSTPVTFEGDAFKELNKLTGGHSFIDNGILNTIMDNEVIDVPVPIISDSSVLLETPIRRDNNLEIKMLFKPDILIGQLFEVQSSVSPNFNGQFKVIDYAHDCLFSATQSGSRTTTVNLWLGPMLPKSNISLTNEEVQSGFNKVKGQEISPVQNKVNTNWIMPCKGRISSPYGWRIHPIYKRRIFHNGIDISVPIGTPVKAIADGKVIKSGSMSGYGIGVVISHGNINGKIVTSEYGHLSQTCVKLGQTVKQGQIIAKSGKTGDSDGAHLHLTIREGAYRGSGVSPYKYIKN